MWSQGHCSVNSRVCRNTWRGPVPSTHLSPFEDILPPTKSFSLRHVILASVLSFKNNGLCSLTPTRTKAHSQVIRILFNFRTHEYTEPERWGGQPAGRINTHTHKQRAVFSRPLAHWRSSGMSFIFQVCLAPHNISQLSISALLDTLRPIWQHPK